MSNIDYATPVNVMGWSGPTIYAVVNTGATGNTNSLATLLAGPNQIGSVTVSSIGAGTAQIGSVTVSSLGAGVAQIGSVTVSSIGAGVAQIGSVTIANMQPLPVGTATIGIVTANSNILAGTAQIGSVTVSSLGAGVAQIGSVTISNMQPLVAGTATIGIMRGTYAEKTWNTLPIVSNISGLATIFVAASAKNFYITNLFISTASVVGLSIMNGATYLTGNASVFAQFAPQSGLVMNGSTLGPLWKSLAVNTSFVVAKDTLAPISGSVTWYEE